MNYITSTQLRTYPTQFIASLIAGEEIDFIHRSKKIGKVKLVKSTNPKPIDIDKLNKLIEELNFPKLTLKQIEKRYHDAMIKKHG